MDIYASRMQKRGFTLIERLGVIAIIAILAVVVVLTLNPAELLRQSRDANRVSDMATLTNALNIYITDQGGSSGFSIGTVSTTYISNLDLSATSTNQCGSLGLPSLNTSTGQAYQCSSSSTYRNVNGGGWIPVNFSKISSGAPLGSLPVDPTGQTSTNLFYTYSTNGTQFELTAIPESSKYRAAQITAAPITTIPGPIAEGSSLSLSSLFNPSGLVRYWKFNEATGSLFYDFSGNNDTGNSYGATGWAAGSKLEASAMNIPGSVYVGDLLTTSLPTTQITVSAWVKVSAHANWHNYINENWVNPGAWLLYSDSGGNAIFGVVNSSDSQINAQGCLAAFTTGTWHFLAGTYDGSNVRVYLDGVSCSGPVSLASQSLSTSVAVISNAASPGSYAMNDAKVYNRALSAAEIMAIYNAEK